MSFYGGHPLSWWRMPGQLRDAMISWIPKLQAEQTLLMADAVAIGVGPMGDRDRAKALRDRVRDLKRVIGLDTVKRARTQREHFDRLAEAGFPVMVDGKPYVPGGGDAAS